MGRDRLVVQQPALMAAWGPGARGRGRVATERLRILYLAMTV